MKGIYIHIPFCIKKCRYCDFNSGVFDNGAKERYLSALLCEMAAYRGTEADTVYIGGGTPTVFETKQLKRLIEAVKSNFILVDDTEFTVEMNPKTADLDKLKTLFEMGVNRLSIGVQSFCDAELHALGRVHSGKDAIDAIALAREAGFENISIDLMSGIPEQTEESFSETLKTAILQAPGHISCYSLIVEEGTPLFDDVKSGKVTLCDDETDRKLYDYAVGELEKNGYKRYEISNFAKSGRASRHNIKYWTMEEYLGLGLSAHSFLNGVRYWNTDDIEKYIADSVGTRKSEALTENDMMSEFVFLGLRMTDGILEKAFSEKFGKDIFEVFKKPLEKFVENGLLLRENGRICLSDKAVSVSNQIMCEFLI